VIVAVAATFAVFAGAASASSFSGSCKFSGPITPEPPITLVPRPAPQFEYSGSGVCGGRPGSGGGLGVGFASFNPGNQTTALEHCLTTGIAAASLSASFSTLRPLLGT